MKKIVEVEIRNIKVKADESKECGYYSYDWKIMVDNQLYLKGTYDSDYEGWDKTEFKQVLEENAWSDTLNREFES